jgi:hypothetical protein
MELAVETVARAYRTVRETGAADYPAYLAARDTGRAARSCRRPRPERYCRPPDCRSVQRRPSVGRHQMVAAMTDTLQLSDRSDDKLLAVLNHDWPDPDDDLGAE